MPFNSRHGIINICTYQVWIYGNNPNGNLSHYSILAKHYQKHVILREDEGFRSQLDMNEKDFYKFHVANDSNIDEVNFYVDLVLEIHSVFIQKQ